MLNFSLCHVDQYWEDANFLGAAGSSLPLLYRLCDDGIPPGRGAPLGEYMGEGLSSSSSSGTAEIPYSDVTASDVCLSFFFDFFSFFYFFVGTVFDFGRPTFHDSPFKVLNEVSGGYTHCISASSYADHEQD